MVHSLTLLQKIENYIEKIKQYNQIAKISEIGRRYFAMNSFDGILTILGLLFGSYIAGIKDPKIIITTGLGASIAMGVSGLWGTYMTEHAERRKRIRELEKATLHRIQHTRINEAEDFAAVAISLIDGFSPFVASLIVISPFFFSAFFPIEIIFYIAWGIGFLILGGLGLFLGKISEENIYFSALKMILAGFFCMLLSLILTGI